MPTDNQFELSAENEILHTFLFYFFFIKELIKYSRLRVPSCIGCKIILLKSIDLYRRQLLDFDRNKSPKFSIKI